MGLLGFSGLRVLEGLVFRVLGVGASERDPTESLQVEGSFRKTESCV